MSRKAKAPDVVVPVTPPEDDLTCVGPHERVLTISIVGRFERTPAATMADKTGRPNASPPLLPAGHAEGGAAGAPDGKGGRAGTPGPPGGKPGARSSTPSKQTRVDEVREKEAQAASAAAAGAYPTFPFTVNKPFFTLTVPGYETILAGTGSGAAASASTPTAPAPPATAGPGAKAASAGGGGTSGPGLPQQSSGFGAGPASGTAPAGPLRVLPTAEGVRADGRFSIDLFQRKLVVRPALVDDVLGHPFTFQAHAVPATAAIRPVQPPPPDPKSSKGGKPAGGASQGRGGKGKAGIEPVDPSQDPATVPLTLATLLVRQSFDLAEVLAAATNDRVDLLVPLEDCDWSAQSASSTDVPPPLSKAAERRATANVRARIAGFTELRILISVSEPLLCQASLSRYLPLVVDVVGVSNLPPWLRGGLALDHTQNPASDEATFRPTEHRTQHAVNPFDVAANARAGAPSFAEVTVRVSVPAVLSSYQTRPLKHARYVEVLDRRIFFLYRLPAHELLAAFFFGSLAFEVHDRDTCEGGGDASAHGFFQTSLRAALSGETRFTISGQVVPRRPPGDDAAGAVYTADYLSNATTVHAKLRLLAPLPRAVYAVPRALSGVPGVPSPSLSAPFGAAPHLSRLVVVIPYRTADTRRILRAFLGALMQFPKASEDAGGVIEAPRDVPAPPPPPVEPPPPEKNAKPPSASGRRAKGKTSEKDVPVVPEPPPLESLLPPPLYTSTMLVPPGVSGFELTDGVSRIFVVEAYLHIVHRLATVMSAVLAESADEDPSVRVLMNTDLAFPQRWYHAFPPLVTPDPDDTPHGLVGTQAPPAAVTDAEAAAAAASLRDAQAPGAPPGGAKADPKDKKGKEKKLTPAQKAALVEAAEQERLRVLAEQEAEALAAEQAAQRAKLRNLRDDLDAGGVGGRIRRIRLAQPLDELHHRQGHFIRQHQAPRTLRAIEALVALREARTLVSALDQGAFPTPDELVSLDRVYGDALSLVDICGAERYVAFDAADTEGALADAGKDQREREVQRRRPSHREPTAMELLRGGLSPSHIGRVLDFIATPATSAQVAGLRPLAASYFPRYQHKNYMAITTPESDAAPLVVLCCYTGPPPSQLLRYHVNAQVVAALAHAADVEPRPVLFVLHHDTVARNGSDHRNPAYEAHLRREQKRADPRLFKAISAQKEAHYRATHTIQQGGGTAKGGDSSEEDEQPGFVDPPPYAPDDDDADEGRIDGILVRGDYVALNRDVTASLGRCGRAPNEEPRRERAAAEALHARCQHLYDVQSRRLQQIDERVASGIQRAHHAGHFVSGSGRTAAEARRHPKSGDASMLNDSQEGLPPATAGSSPTHTQTHAVTLPRMQFHGARDLLRSDPPRDDTTMAGEAAHSAAVQQAEKDRWRSKVLVATDRMAVSARAPRDQPLCSLSKYAGILQDPPAKHSLRDAFVPPAVAGMALPEPVVPLPRVEPSVVKHPEHQTFYYAPPERKEHVKPAPLSSKEKLSPLFR